MSWRDAGRTHRAEGNRNVSAEEDRGRQSADWIRQRWPRRPTAAIILGTGLGALAEHVEQEATFAYSEIPHFIRPTALSHQGRLVCGKLGGAQVLAFEGRCHLYEGRTQADVTHPVFTARGLGAEMLIASNASGGVNPLYAIGDIVVVDDHIDLMWQAPASSGAAWNPRAISRTGPLYDEQLRDAALAIARRGAFVAHRGVYVAVTGPNYETRAEYRCFRRLGGDVVGMSTAPEACAAAGLGMRVLALSTVTNMARPDAPHVVAAEDVVAAANAAEPHLRKIVTEIVREFAGK